MPTQVNTHAREASRPTAEPLRLRGSRIAVPENFAEDLRTYEIVPKPLADDHKQLLVAPKVAGTNVPNRALLDAIATYRGEGPAYGEPTPFYRMKCPVSLECVTDPVQLADGYTYDRASADTWVNRNNRKQSPMTNERLPEPVQLYCDPKNLHLVLYGHLADNGSWEGVPTTLDRVPLPQVPTRRIAWAISGITGGLAGGLTAAGVNIGAYFTLANPPGFQWDRCDLGNCGNVATQSFGTINATIFDAVVGQNQSWRLLNTVNTTGQAAIDACRALADACFANQVPRQQAFEERVAAYNADAHRLGYIGDAIGVGLLALALGAGAGYVWYSTRHERRAWRQARATRVEASKIYENVEDMLRTDMAQLSKKKAATQAAPRDIEMTSI